MTVAEIQERAKNEAAVFELAKQIRELLDKAAKEIELPDGREVEEEVLALVTDN